MWPLCSVLVGILSEPVLLVSGGYLFVKILETGRLPLIYTGLFVGVVCGAATWYGLRRLACRVDVAWAQKRGETGASREALEEFIR